MDQEPEGYGKPRQKTREELMEEAWRAEQAIMSSTFGDGDRAVFGGEQKQTRADARVQRRMEMMDRLGATIANKLAEQFSSLPSAIAEAIKGVDRPQSIQETNAEYHQGGGERPSSPSHATKQVPDVSLSRQPHVESAEAGWQPSKTDRSPQEVELEDPNVRPAVLRDYPVDRLPMSPAGLPKATPMRSLDDEPESREAPELDIPRPSFRTEQTRSEPMQPREFSRSRTFEPEHASQSHPPTRFPQVYPDPVGQPTPEVAGGQMSEMTELVREVAESNQQFHHAMTMFVRMIVEAQQRTTEEIYQAMTALDRQEGPR